MGPGQPSTSTELRCAECLSRLERSQQCLGRPLMGKQFDGPTVLRVRDCDDAARFVCSRVTANLWDHTERAFLVLKRQSRARVSALQSRSSSASPTFPFGAALPPSSWLFLMIARTALISLPVP